MRLFRRRRAKTPPLVVVLHGSPDPGVIASKLADHLTLRKER